MGVSVLTHPSPCFRVNQNPQTRLIDERLRAEIGRIAKQAPLRVALAYPSPYGVAMSSLGYQRIYRAIQETDGHGVRARLLARRRGCPARETRPGHLRVADARSASSPSSPSRSPTSSRSPGSFSCSRPAGIPPLREERERASTRSSSRAARSRSRTRCRSRPYADAVIMGEAEALVTRRSLATIAGAVVATPRSHALAAMPHVFVPEHHGEVLPYGRAVRRRCSCPRGRPFARRTPSSPTCSSSRPSAAARAAARTA